MSVQSDIEMIKQCINRAIDSDIDGTADSEDCNGALAAMDRIAASHEALFEAVEGFRNRFDQRFSDISDFAVVYPDLAAALPGDGR